MLTYAALAAPTSIVQPEPQGGARIITPVKLAGAAKASPQVSLMDVC
jgi:hypothetical protein